MFSLGAKHAPEIRCNSNIPAHRQPLTFNIGEAADFLKVHRNTVLQLVERGDFPGAKIGRAWVFLVEDLIAYLREQTHKQMSQRRKEHE